jgi:hypothetical protein
VRITKKLGKWMSVSAGSAKFAERLFCYPYASADSKGLGGAFSTPVALKKLDSSGGAREDKNAKIFLIT